MLSLKLTAVRSRLLHRFPTLLAVPALVVMASCGAGDDGLGKRYPVSGTVTYNGKPLDKGRRPGPIGRTRRPATLALWFFFNDISHLFIH